MVPETCPDCNQPIVAHELYKDGRCPVVRFAGIPLVADPTVERGVAELRNPDGSVAARIRVD